MVKPQHKISSVVLALVCGQILSLWRRGCCMWGWTLQSYVFSCVTVSRYRSKLMAFCSVGCHPSLRDFFKLFPKLTPQCQMVVMSTHSCP